MGQITIFDFIKEESKYKLLKSPYDSFWCAMGSDKNRMEWHPTLKMYVYCTIYGVRCIFFKSNKGEKNEKRTTRNCNKH